MNIFVVSSPSSTFDSQALVSNLSRIHFESGKTVSVIVVDKRYNLGALPTRSRPTDHKRFKLLDFLHSTTHEVQAEKVAQHMDKVQNSWVLIDLCQHDQTTCDDLIFKLSRYCFLSPALRNRNIVFTTPAIHLGSTAGTINMSFNVLPMSNHTRNQSNQMKILFMAVDLERVLIYVPFLRSILHRVRVLSHLAYRRFARRA